MSTLAVAQPKLEGLESGATLDDVVSGAWSALRAHQVVRCPVCHGGMGPEYGAQALPIAGGCADCGAMLR